MNTMTYEVTGRIARVTLNRPERGNGITLEYPVIRHMNNLESVVTYEGTNEVLTLVLGQAIAPVQIAGALIVVGTVMTLGLRR